NRRGLGRTTGSFPGRAEQVSRVSCANCWKHSVTIFLQGDGIRRATHGTGAASDRTRVCRGRARQGAIAVGGTKVGFAPAGIGSAARKAPPIYVLELQPEVLPKSASGAAVRYALNQWDALTRFLEDGELEIDNG